MKAITTLCLANIRKKKVQNGLMIILIVLSTLLLATSVTILQNTENLFEKKHEETKGAHQILTMGTEYHNPILVNKWWSEQEGVTSSNLVSFRNLSGIKYAGKEIPNLYLYMMNTPKTTPVIDKLIVAEGNEQLYPEKGGIWIPTSLASSYGISLGDVIEFQNGENTFSLSVSTIVVDLAFGGPFTTNARIWMNESDYKEYLQSMTGNQQYMMSLRFDDYSKKDSYWSDFENYLNMPYLETKIEYEEISAFYVIISKVLGFIMVGLGIVMMFVSVFIISFSISDAILSNYKTIGVMKSIGLTSREIIGVYVMQYGMIAFVSIIPGLIISGILSRLIIESSLSFLKVGNDQGNVQGFSDSILIGAAILLIVISTAFLCSRKARKVEPAQAIKYGMPEAANSKIAKRLNHSSKWFRFKNLSIQMQIGLKNITKNRKNSLVIITLTMLTSTVLVFSFVLLNSIISIKQTASQWGYDSANIAASIYNKDAFSKEDFEKDLLEDSRVKNFGWSGGLTGVIPNKSDQPVNISINVIEGGFDNLGYENIQGRNPRHKNEIALGVNVATSLKKDIGDFVEIYLEGEKYSLLITGIYQSIANMSYSARIPADVVKVNNPDYTVSDVVYINLVDTGKSEELVSELNEKYKDFLSASTQETLLDSVFKEAAAILLMPLSAIGLMFIIVTFIIIFSISYINVRKESSVYGIYKSIGMTSNKIRWSITLGVFVLSAIGALLGIVAGIKIMPLLLQSILTQYGLVELPLVLNWGMTIGIASLSLLTVCIGCWLSTRLISHTSPRILIIE